MDQYSVNIGGVSRNLPIVPINKQISIAFMNIYGDNELFKEIARLLIAEIPSDTQIIIAPEMGGIVLANYISIQTGIPYIAVRKKRRPYMIKYICCDLKSIGTESLQTLYIGADERDLLQEKKVLILDEVISSGSTVNALNELVNLCGGERIGYLCIAVEGDFPKLVDLRYLCHLPIFYR